MPIPKPGANLKFAPPATNFVDCIRAGRVVPLISDEACFDLAKITHRVEWQVDRYTIGQERFTNALFGMLDATWLKIDKQKAAFTIACATNLASSSQVERIFGDTERISW